MKRTDFMENIFLHIKEALENNRDVMLNMIIASSGSTPRGKGAKMLVYEDGTIYGTMGGGNAEHLCTLRSVKALKEKESFTASYDMSRKDIEGVGMICGGNVEVCFRYFSPSDMPFVKADYSFDSDTKSLNISLTTRPHDGWHKMGETLNLHSIAYIISIAKSDITIDGKLVPYEELNIEVTGKLMLD